MITNPNSQRRCERCGKTKPLRMFTFVQEQKNEQEAYCRVCKILSDTPYMNKGQAEALAHAEAKMQRRIEREESGLPRREAKRSAKYQTESEIQADALAFADAMAQWEANKEAKALARAEAKAQRHMKREAKALARTEAATQIKSQKKNETVSKWLYRIESRPRKEIKGLAKIHARIESRRLIKKKQPPGIYSRYARLRANGGSHTKQELNDLLEAQNHQCAYCERTVPLTIDHIFPVSRGGRDDIANICWACWRCNLTKHAKTLNEWTDRWYLRKK